MQKNQLCTIMKFSKKDVVRAGIALTNDNLINDEESFQKTMDVLTYWRDSHVFPLNNAHQLLNKFVLKVDENAFIAKRLKRFDSIKKKLQRFEQMQLKNMQDIGGIRVVVTTLEQVNSIFNTLAQEVYFHNNGQFIKFDNYIEKPKDDGYRSLHMVGKFNTDDHDERKIEFQIRTKLQHSWATSLEIVDIFTGQNLKGNAGFANYQTFFKNISDQFQIMENLKGFKNNDKGTFLKEYLRDAITNRKNINQCLEITEFLDRKIGNNSIEQQLKYYCETAKKINHDLSSGKFANGFVLIQLDTDTQKIDYDFFPKENHSEASLKYSYYEKEFSKQKHLIVTLLSTDAMGGLKQAYPNYFADSEFFLAHVKYIKMVAELIKIQRKIEKLQSSTI